MLRDESFVMVLRCGRAHASTRPPRSASRTASASRCSIALIRRRGQFRPTGSARGGSTRSFQSQSEADCEIGRQPKGESVGIVQVCRMTCASPRRVIVIEEPIRKATFPSGRSQNGCMLVRIDRAYIFREQVEATVVTRACGLNEPEHIVHAKFAIGPAT